MQRQKEQRSWRQNIQDNAPASIVSGLIAGIAMGVVIQAGSNLMPLIGSLYGMESIPGGWIAHLFNSVLFGIIYGVVVAHPLAGKQLRTSSPYIGVAIVYAAVLGLVSGGFLLPLWISFSGIETLSVPFIPIAVTGEEFVSSLFFALGHIAYGFVLGTVYVVATGKASITEIQPTSTQPEN